MRINGLNIKVTNKRLISLEDTMRILGKSRKTVYNYIDSGRLTKNKILATPYFDVWEVKRLLKARKG